MPPTTTKSCQRWTQNAAREMHIRTTEALRPFSVHYQMSSMDAANVKVRDVLRDELRVADCRSPCQISSIVTITTAC